MEDGGNDVVGNKEGSEEEGSGGGMKGRVRRVKDLQMTPHPRRKRTDVNACRFNPNYKVSPPYSLLPSPASIHYIMFIRCLSLHVAPLLHA